MKRHRTDGVSLVFALIFLAIAAWWLIARLVDLALPAVGWFLAGALILVGILGLLGALRSGRHAGEPAGPAPASGSIDPVEPADPSNSSTRHRTIRYYPIRCPDRQPDRTVAPPSRTRWTIGTDARRCGSHQAPKLAGGESASAGRFTLCDRKPPYRRRSRRRTNQTSRGARPT